MLKFYFNRRTVLGFFISLVLLSILAVYSHTTTKDLISSSRMVAHTNVVLHNTEKVLSSVVGLELGQRGYSLTGNKEFLTPFHNAKSSMNVSVNNLLLLTVDNYQQQKRVLVLKKDINDLFLFSSSAIEMRAKSFEAAQTYNASMDGKRLLDKVRITIAQIQEEENALLQQRIEQNQMEASKVNYTYIGLVLVTGLILSVVFYGINVSLLARTRSEHQLLRASSEIQDLYDNAPCGYHSLDGQGKFVDINRTMLRWLGYEKSEVLGRLTFADIISEENLGMFQESFAMFKQQGFIHNLEFTLVRKDKSTFPVILSSTAIMNEAGKYVKSRSITIDNTARKLAETKINALNQELESFSYSVSHDLRAPLRAIDGYAKILQEDYSEKLDVEGNRILKIITSNARRMGLLIDDLLEFSQLGRKEVTKAEVNMSVMVRAIVAELQELDQIRKVQITIHDLAPSLCDVNMIRQVWINLISNAIKYSSKTANALVHISSDVQGHEVVYQVKDNGVGFDMTYVGKLFGVFQRLHKLEDFSGTGVGLAIVKRIISRHKGRVWAEAKPNEGATFYFTIPKEDDGRE
jgi:PAS domain S-box-containing protein